VFQTEVFDVYFLGGAVCECGRLHLGARAQDAQALADLCSFFLLTLT